VMDATKRLSLGFRVNSQTRRLTYDACHVYYAIAIKGGDEATLNTFVEVESLV